jgi:hypothetical protein
VPTKLSDARSFSWPFRRAADLLKLVDRLAAFSDGTPTD